MARALRAAAGPGAAAVGAGVAAVASLHDRRARARIPIVLGCRMTVLETARLRLRQLTTEDAPFMRALLNEPSFIRNIGDRGVRTVEDARAYLERGPIASYEQHGFGLYLVELKETGAPIGICGLVKRDELPDVDIGFAFLPAFWSKGYAFESASAVKRYAADTIGLRRLIAIVNPANAGSIRLLEKIGLRFDRMIRLGVDGADLKLFAAACAPSLRRGAARRRSRRRGCRAAER